MPLVAGVALSMDCGAAAAAAAVWFAVAVLQCFRTRKNISNSAYKVVGTGMDGAHKTVHSSYNA